MRAFFEVINTDKIEMQLTMTMVLKEWKELRNQLINEWPSSDLSRDIADLVGQAEKHFYLKKEEKE